MSFRLISRPWAGAVGKLPPGDRGYPDASEWGEPAPLTGVLVCDECLTAYDDDDPDAPRPAFAGLCKPCARRAKCR